MVKLAIEADPPLYPLGATVRDTVSRRDVIVRSQIIEIKSTHGVNGTTTEIYYKYVVEYVGNG